MPPNFPGLSFLFSKTGLALAIRLALWLPGKDQKRNIPECRFVTQPRSGLFVSLGGLFASLSLIINIKLSDELENNLQTVKGWVHRSGGHTSGSSLPPSSLSGSLLQEVHPIPHSTLFGRKLTEADVTVNGTGTTHREEHTISRQRIQICGEGTYICFLPEYILSFFLFFL